MNTITLSTFAVRNSDGSVDSAATVSKFEDTLQNFIVEREAENAKIASAVSQALDSAGGKRLGFDFLVDTARRTMNVQAENYNTLGDKIREYVRENATEKTEAGTPADPSKPYHISRGKGGGVGRWSDLLAAKK